MSGLSCSMPSQARQRAVTTNFGCIAHQAGVSITTVDRVLNQRGHVSQKTRMKVIQAARTLGIQRVLPPVLDQPRRVDVILPSYGDAYANEMRAIFACEVARLQRPLVLEFLSGWEREPRALARHLARLQASAIPAIIAAPWLVPGAAVSTNGRAPALALGEPPEAAPAMPSVTTHDYAAGRLAAEFFLSMTGGPARYCVLRSGSGRDVAERVRGFKDKLGERGRESEVEEIMATGMDHHDRLLVSNVLPADGCMVYVPSAYGTDLQTLIPAVKSDRQRWIVHGHTETTAALLRDGAINALVDAHVADSVHAVLARLLTLLGDRQDAPASSIGPRIVMAESIT